MKKYIDESVERKNSVKQDTLLSAFNQYRQEVSWIPQLADGEEIRLLECIERRKVECPRQCSECDACRSAEQASTRLIEGYQHLVSRLAWRYASRNQQLYLDLVQEGNLALLRALEGYDNRIGVASFGTWAFAWVRGAMHRASYDSVIRLPWRQVQAIRQLEQVCDELSCLLGHEPTVEEIAHAMKITSQEVCERFVQREQYAVVSMDTPIDEEGEVTIRDTLEDTSRSDEAGDSLEDALQHLTDEELAVILTRYGLGEHGAHSQQEAARVLGMKLSKVQLLDQRARVRLRRVIREQAG